MQEIITLSISLGLFLSLFFSEMLGIAAGGMVVPGYMALYLGKPMHIAITLMVSYVTFFIVNTLSSVMIIYGKRRTLSMILVGFMLGWFVRLLGPVPVGYQSVDLAIVGYIIPGLIAIWMDRQGILITITTLLTTSVIIRLILILIIGKEITL